MNTAGLFPANHEFPPGMSFLCNFDFSSIEEMDPSLCGGFMNVYEREIPCEIRFQEAGTQAPQEIGTVESVTMKVLIKGSECAPDIVRIELTSENDMFLHLHHTATERQFAELSDTQQLLVEYFDYPNVLVKMGNSCIREPHSFMGVLILESDGKAWLNFIQNMEYKFVELLAIPLQQSPEEAIRNSITYRHHVLRSKLAMLHARLQDVGALLKSKNPALLQQLEKCSAALNVACPPVLPSPYPFANARNGQTDRPAGGPAGGPANGRKSRKRLASDSDSEELRGHETGSETGSSVVRPAARHESRYAAKNI